MTRATLVLSRVRRPGAGLLFAGTLVFLALLALGSWQAFMRLPQKLALIERERERSDSPAVSWNASLDYPHGQPVVLRGQLLPEQAIFLRGGTYEGRSGGWLVAPLHQDGQVTWVRLGWLPRNLEAQIGRLVPAQPLQFEAFVQQPSTASRRPFQAQNDPANDIWVRMDPLAFSRAQGLPLAETRLDWLHWRSPNLPDAWPIALPPGHGLNNNHLAYALTWYSLALALLFILWRRWQTLKAPA